MQENRFPVIDMEATGRNILRLRKARGLSVRDIQQFLGFEAPRVIYMWQHGQCLPSVDNLYALSILLGVSMNEILISAAGRREMQANEQQAAACCSAFLFRLPGMRRTFGPSRPIRLSPRPRPDGPSEERRPGTARWGRGNRGITFL